MNVGKAGIQGLVYLCCEFAGRGVAINRDRRVKHHVHAHRWLFEQPNEV